MCLLMFVLQLNVIRKMIAKQFKKSQHNKKTKNKSFWHLFVLFIFIHLYHMIIYLFIF